MGESTVWHRIITARICVGCYVAFRKSKTLPPDRKWPDRFRALRTAPRAPDGLPPAPEHEALGELGNAVPPLRACCIAHRKKDATMDV